MTSTTVEVVAPEEAQLVAVVRKESLPPAVETNIRSVFMPLYATAHKLIEQSRQIIVTDVSQKLERKHSRDFRLALRDVRLEGDVAHKALKDQALREGRTIDAFRTILRSMVEAEEKRLKEQEDYVEIQEEKRQAALTEARSLVLTGLNINPALYQLGAMDEAVFQQLVEGTKLARAAEAERAKKAEADRIEREAKEQAERERIRQENERLKREADEKEAALKAEREKVEKEKADAAIAAKAELDRREALAAEERRKHEEAAAEIRRVAKEAADKAEKELAEQKRIAEQAAAAERTRVEKERIAAEAIAKAEREKVEEAARKAAKVAADKAKAEREAREKVEAELRTAKEEQAARHAAQLEAERKAAAAPDKDKLLTYANAIRALEIPTLSTPEAQAIATVIKASRDKFVSWCEEKASAL